MEISNVKESWKPIKDFPFYEISNRGRIKSYCGAVPRIRSFSYSEGRPLIILSKKGKTYGFLIHRLVLEHFIGPCPLGYEANHKNGIKTDNWISNLEWVTSSENKAHAYRIGLLSRAGELAPYGRAKLKNEDVLKIRRLTRKGVKRSVLSKMFGVSRTTVHHIIHRITWSHI